VDHDTSVLEGNDVSHDETAAALFRSADLELVWSNAAYRDLLEEPHRTVGAEGLSLPDFSPIGSATKTEAMLRCLQTGTPECGDYRIFSVEDGTDLRRWSVYRPMENHLLLLVNRERPSITRND